MSAKKISFILFCALIARTGSAQEILRLAVETKYKLSPEAQVDFTDAQSVIAALKAGGIYVDDKSSIFIHEEENSVNLTCFSCLVRDVGEQVDFHSSYNERATK